MSALLGLRVENASVRCILVWHDLCTRIVFSGKYEMWWLISSPNSIFLPHALQGVFSSSIRFSSHSFEQNSPSPPKSLPQNLQYPFGVSRTPFSSSNPRPTSSNSGVSYRKKKNLHLQPATKRRLNSSSTDLLLFHPGTSLLKLRKNAGLVSLQMGTSFVPLMSAKKQPSGIFL